MIGREFRWKKSIKLESFWQYFVKDLYRFCWVILIICITIKVAIFIDHSSLSVRTMYLALEINWYGTIGGTKKSKWDAGTQMGGPHSEEVMWLKGEGTKRIKGKMRREEEGRLILNFYGQLWLIKGENLAFWKLNNPGGDFSFSNSWTWGVFLLSLFGFWVMTM